MEEDRPRELQPLTNKKKTGLKIGVTSLVIVLLALSFLTGYTIAFLQLPRATSLIPTLSFDQFRSQSEQAAEQRDLDFSLFWEVWDKLYEQHIDRATLKAEDLYYGAIKGLVKAVGDPYTEFYDQKANEAFSEDLSGSFEGIGAEVGVRNGRLVIVAPLPGSPAELAGVRAGDYIVAIDKKDTNDLNLDEAVFMIRGPRDSKVTLTLLRADNGSEVFDVEITRQKIDVPVVEWTMGDDKIAYINIISFTQGSEKKFIKAMTEILKSDPVGVIVDVRNDPGGFLTEAVYIASAWVNENDIVVREVFTDASQNFDYPAKQQIRAPKVPTIVLINEGSASASEILAGALQDYELATIVGTKSYGKGSVQVFEQLSGGNALKISTAKWLTPKGRTIQGEGIVPDIEVQITDDDIANNYDAQLEKAKSLILGEF